ncbi:undecaprenyldiphospho-muramoylpentapeptide beta-N-acetylglucosaminyltransferase [Alsobacter sp. SYSU M60028]|uniref:UDP-N-acetylglucosamine--N-acetylmuramyl-(pentapeptide) pyrophosphoryl-undecaprenol N-acetylglucosamine transferase n=1 Tax=Alsobacter ponti TaxID=2962936 RepID=A0ABT1L6W6_9HYPH|nr:undecaprenyldiphospho-muramoylpentapeptide beta-N-acetylglucosaminyltransferase [Alsobacter ponti]MCP8937180.1 undecaprenyldiphospho-muramoylpentapeptide beta-N-acetylglucosaminyltransferase [Alsobacter ponti]
MATARPILLAAGGTGGHLFPAEALAVALGRHGVTVHLATDERASRYGGQFPAEAIHEIPSATPSGGSVGGKVVAALKLGQGVLESFFMENRVKPLAVVGFGGYPTVPPVLAASLRGIPTVIHEQNGVLGRANRLLAPRARVIATGFAEVRGLAPGLRGRLVQTGNPVRPAVLEAAKTPFSPPGPDGTLDLVVFGGSQGARVMSDILPPALALMKPAHRARLSIVQQAREEDLERVRAAYAELGVKAELAPFFRDLPARIAAADLVVGRSGASTVAELGVIGRPAILVPLPHSLDGDQAANAAALAAAGGAVVIPQADFTPERLAGELAARLEDPDTLVRAADAARRSGISDASERLAAVVMRLAGLQLKETAA